MSLASDAGTPAPGALAKAGAWSAGAAAVAVSLLMVGTLGTVGAMTVGAALHLLGVPDAWAATAACLVAVSALIPAAALARRIWQVERQGVAG